MGSCSHLSALLKKNLILIKRKPITSLCEIIFPFILLAIVIALRSAFEINKFYYGNTPDTEYIQTNSTALFTSTSSDPSTSEDFYTLTIRKHLDICKQRPIIALIGESFPSELQSKLSQLIQVENPIITFKQFDSADELDKHVEHEHYAEDLNEYPPICFGIKVEETESSTTKAYDVSLHYFGSDRDNGVKDIPSTITENLDPFQNGPDMDSYKRYITSGYLYIMKLIYDYILQKETNTNTAQINYGVVAQKFTMYQEDPFSLFIGMILPFFLVVAYLVPLALQVSKMVVEKESRVKEGMKIMGLGEGMYFLSYFIQFFIINILYTIVNGLITTQVFKHTDVLYLFAFYFLFGMNIFALAFFFQSFIDKTRLAIIVSILGYFLMYFLSIAVYSDNVKNVVKMVLSIFPPTALQLGIGTFGTFDSAGLKFGFDSVKVRASNYSVADMYLMLFIDLVIYFFLGFFLQNVVPHDYGISRPVYFLCTREFWGCAKKNNKAIVTNTVVVNKDDNKDDNKAEHNANSDNNDVYKYNDKGGSEREVTINGSNDYFQNEEFYKDKTGPKDALRITNLTKEFDDGKIAVNNVSFNLYKDEIFALLGHNGAGKTTTISMLTGLYEATSGNAVYDGMNVLDSSNMDIFRKRLGICPQHDVLFEDLSVEEHLNMFCTFKGYTGDAAKENIDKIISDFKLDDQREVLVKNLSAGNRRKLSIAISLVGGSEVIFLDEPSSGMDITSRRNLWDILKQCARDKIIVLTTHYMEEAAVLGKRIGIISEGHMRCIGSPLFLIEKFGKYISITVTKEEDAVNEDIIKFFKDNTSENGNLQCEVLSEEILFRIPKDDTAFNVGEFFTKLDNNVQTLKIKSYGASMPTLEDVFLNVSLLEKEKNDNNDNNNEDNEEVDIDTEKVLFDESNYNEQKSSCGKFSTDLSVSLKKRLFQVIRDKKTFILEILCPIVLIVIGLAVSSVEFTNGNPSFVLSPSSILSSEQSIYYIDTIYNSQTQEIPSELITDDSNADIKWKELSLEASSSSSDINQNLLTCLNSLYDLNLSNRTVDNSEDSYGAYYFLTIDSSQHLYEFISFVHLQSRQSAIVYPEYMMNKLVHYATGKTESELSITFHNVPFQRTLKEQNDSEERNNATLVFFVAVAFALIPANFVTLIIKEREINTKHLQVISGISLASYWFSNYIFELLKYYVIGGINILLIWAFDFYQDYLWLLYLLYGPSMVSFTYLFSFIFTKESTAQTIVLLLNFIFGALGGCVVLIVRLMADLTEAGKVIAYILRIVPSFCFCYGYNELLSSFGLFRIDEPNMEKYVKMTFKDMLGINYIGMDCIYMGIEAVLYLVFIIIIEATQGGGSCSQKQSTEDNAVNEDNEMQLSCDDSQVYKERDKVYNNNKEQHSEQTQCSVKIRSLNKTYNKYLCCCKKQRIQAVKNISFQLNYGECFGLLGINGAGKTTTFKCLTNEILSTKGDIYINNKNIRSHFHEVRSLIGYCPQFDSIFEYMTVYENLEFYAKIKGVVSDKVDMVIKALMKEMNLLQYKTKVSGQLSGGNKRKLAVSIAMICNPPIVLLDEPSTGMDPEARRFMWGIIHKISTRSGKSSVLMTTHSMDEAETLCRRMGILVNGEFKCIGSATSIKEKYGSGYEINLTIRPPSDNDVDSLVNSINANKMDEIKTDDIEHYIKQLGKDNYLSEISKKENGLAYKLFKELELNGKITLLKIISWFHYLKNALAVVAKVKEYFPKIELAELVDNAFLFKINKGEQSDVKSIGFLFGFIEKIKEEYCVEEYSIQKTSLEQIFQMFEMQKDKGNKEKIEIEITDDIISSIVDGKVIQKTNTTIDEKGKNLTSENEMLVKGK